MENDKRTSLKVEGMDCANCAQTITRTLQKTGFQDVQVNFITGDVDFEKVGPELTSKAIEEINGLGYLVVDHRINQDTDLSAEDVHIHSAGQHQLKRTSEKFYFSLIFTVPLLLNMAFPHSFLQHPILQLALCIPVMITGWNHFGRSAWKSVRAGTANMDVLISLGSSAAFFYSLSGTLLYFGKPEVHQFLFYETAATIITLVLLGNMIEQRSVRRTTSAIEELSRLQATRANKIVQENGTERIVVVEIEKILPGDLVQVNSGDKIPVDGIIESGTGLVNESIITGESMPVSKSKGDQVTGSTVTESGSFRIRAEKVGEESTLSQIISLVKNARMSKPPIQQLGDRISAVFVPTVIMISLVTFIISLLFRDLSTRKSLLNSIAVLVISCPCAMGLAAPTAIMVGLGRAARNGVLIKGGRTLELLSSLETIVFDKTGTLTTGNFKIKNLNVHDGNEDEIKALLFALERNSSHPIATSIKKELNDFEPKAEKIQWKKIDEDKGIGMNASDGSGDLYSLGSFQMVRHFYQDLNHSLYLLKNNKLIATVDLEDEIKPGCAEAIATLKKNGIRVVMVSGDRDEVCRNVGEKTGIEEIYSEKLPSQKLELISGFSKQAPTAMIGDGINDAPALAKANLGISMSDATAIAIQSAQVILLHQQDMMILLKALRIGRGTYNTIKQNFFWAFFYNLIAIPIAAAGFLNPMIGALSMAFSDIVVVGNSMRLRFKKL